MRLSQDNFGKDMGQEDRKMPLGIQQNNSFIKLTIDVWQDKVFYNEQEYPAAISPRLF